MEANEVRIESVISKHLFQKADASNIPISGTFELSPVCNFTCRMCYVRKTPAEVTAHSRPMVSLEQWISIAEQARKEGMLFLLLTGGEPFLWPHFWELYEKLIQMGFVISINTNGSLIDDAVVKKLKALPPSRVNITLYGASDETYESLCMAKGIFSKVDNAIQKLKEAGIPVKLNCSLTPYNAADLEAMNEYAVRNQLVFDVATYMFPPLRRDSSMVGRNERFTSREAAYYHLMRYRLQFGMERYTLFLHQIARGMIPPLGLDESCMDPLDGKIRCRAGKAAFWITWDGWLTPCGMMPEPKADLYTASFAEAWEDINKQSLNLVLSGVCAKCANRHVCHACAAMALAETGSASGVPQYLCQMAQELRNIAAEQLATGNYADS